MPKLAILDLIRLGDWSVREGMDRARDLAVHGERWGYGRFWIAEHHNIPGIASSATALAISHVAAGTSTIRVGAGGIMLPNHAPLIIAEQFGTLAHLYPGRIDLGLGRAPGTDQNTQRAMRRPANASDQFPQDVSELRRLLGPTTPGQHIRALPGEGTEVPLWILGSSLFGAQLAASLGLPYGFASHFAPEQMLPALQLYRERFQPSAGQPVPHVAVGINVVLADDDADARRLATTQQMAFADLLRSGQMILKPPIAAIDDYWSAQERARAQRMLARSFIGSPASVRAPLRSFLEHTNADELIVVSDIYDHDRRLRSYELLAELLR